MTAEEPMPQQSLNFAPLAIEAEQVSGYQAENLLRFANSDGTLFNTSPLNDTEYAALVALVDGTSTVYAKVGNATNGTPIYTTTTGTIGSTTVGDMWLDTSTTGHDVLKINTDSGVQTIGLSTSGFISSVVAGTGISVSTTSGAATVGIATGGVGTTELANAGVTGAKLASNIVISTTGTVSAAGVSTNSIALSNTLATPNSLALTVPSGSFTNYGLTFPAGQGATGQVLQLTNVSTGQLGWVSPSAGSVTTVTAAATTGNPIVGTSAPTIDIGKADLTHNGYLASSDFSTLSAKVSGALASANIFVGNSSGLATGVPLTGDVTITNAGVAKVVGIQGVGVGTSAPSVAGQVLRYDGTSTYQANFLSMADIRSTAMPGLTIFPSTNCAAGKTLNWSSLVDQFTCTDIQLTAAQVSGLGTAAALNVGTGSNSVVQLDSSLKLPAVDGSQLTNLNATALTTGTIDPARLPASSSTWAVNGSGIYNTNTGNVGIGTSTPTALLQVGTATLDSGTQFGVGTTNAFEVIPDFTGANEIPANSAFMQVANGGNMVFAANRSGSFTGMTQIAYMSSGFNWKSALEVSNTTSPYSTLNLMKSGGNVGIGTSVPLAALHVRGVDYTSDPALKSQLLVQSVDAYNAAPMAGLTFVTPYNSGGATAGMGAITVAKENATDGDLSSYLSLYTRQGSGAVVEQFRINSLGNVGIGTTAPAYKLQVVGQVDANAFSIAGVPISAGSAGAWSLNGTNTFNTNLANVGVGTSAPLSKLDVNGGVAVGSYAETIAAPTNGLIVSGSVGIGTTSPTQALDVNGSGNFATGLITPLLTTAVGSGLNVLPAAQVTGLSNGSAVSITGGASGLTYGYGGQVNITGGAGFKGAGGPIAISAGPTSGGGGFNGPPVTITAGNASTNGGTPVATGGNILLIPGLGSGGGASGNVGIGTTAPAAALHVVGSFPQAIVQSSGGTTGLRIGGQTDQTAVAEIYRTTSGINASSPTNYERVSIGFNQYTSTGADAFVGTEKGGTGSNRALLLTMGGSELMRLHTNSNVGIGTTAPAYKLQVAGQVDATAFSIGGVPISSGGAGAWSLNGTNTYNTNSASVGVGTSAPLSKLDVNGGVAVGSYAGTVAAPTNGLIVSGNVGIGTTAPRASLDINGSIISAAATVNSTATVDYSKGNIQYTNSSCGSFQFNNMQDGGSYMFVVKGSTAATCAFTAFTGAGSGALTVHMPPDNGYTTASKHTIFSIAVAGADAYVSWAPGY